MAFELSYRAVVLWWQGPLPYVHGARCGHTAALLYGSLGAELLELALSHALYGAAWGAGMREPHAAD